MISNKSYYDNLSPDVGDETEFFECNFTQPEPVDSGGGVYVGGRLFPGDDTPRTFTRCNLVNAEVPPGSTIVKCNTSIRRWSVITGTDEVIVDGTPITANIYSSVIYGRQTAPGVYEYKAVPEELEEAEVE